LSYSWSRTARRPFNSWLTPGAYLFFFFLWATRRLLFLSYPDSRQCLASLFQPSYSSCSSWACAGACMHLSGVSGGDLGSLFNLHVPCSCRGPRQSLAGVFALWINRSPIPSDKFPVAAGPPRITHSLHVAVHQSSAPHLSSFSLMTTRLSPFPAARLLVSFVDFCSTPFSASPSNFPRFPADSFSSLPVGFSLPTVCRRLRICTRGSASQSVCLPLDFAYALSALSLFFTRIAATTARAAVGC